MRNLILLTACFVMFYSYKKRISILLLLSVLVWVFVGQAYKPQIRQVKNNVETSQENNTVLGFNYGYDSNPLVLRLSEPILSIIRVLEIKNIKKKKIRKDTLSILKYSLLPRFMYKDKPTQDFSKWYTGYFFPHYHISEEFKKTVTFNISWTTDLFLNLEYKGSIFLSFILGLLISLLVKTFAHFNSNNINFLLGVSILSPLTFPDYNISLMLSPLILQYIIIFLLIKLILIFIKK